MARIGNATYPRLFRYRRPQTVAITRYLCGDWIEEDPNIKTLPRKERETLRRNRARKEWDAFYVFA